LLPPNPRDFLVGEPLVGANFCWLKQCDGDLAGDLPFPVSGVDGMRMRVDVVGMQCFGDAVEIAGALAVMPNASAWLERR
jgi:hypothetical protein